MLNEGFLDDIQKMEAQRHAEKDPVLCGPGLRRRLLHLLLDVLLHMLLHLVHHLSRTLPARTLK